jgi:hypothetical protein
MHIRRLVLAALGLGDMSDRSVSGVRDLSEGRVQLRARVRRAGVANLRSVRVGWPAMSKPKARRMGPQ